MENNEQYLDITGLIPDIAKVFSFTSAQDLSASFVGLLIVIFIWFIVKAAFSARKARSRTSWILQLLKGQTSDSVAMERITLEEKSKRFKEQNKDKNNVGHLWLEFNETLVSSGFGENLKLHYVYDADYFQPVNTPYFTRQLAALAVSIRLR